MEEGRCPLCGAEVLALITADYVIQRFRADGEWLVWSPADLAAADASDLESVRAESIHCRNGHTDEEMIPVLLSRGAPVDPTLVP